MVAFALSPATLSAAQGNPARRVELSLLNRKVAGAEVRPSGRLPGVVRVTQGETIELVWAADEATTLHLHGYNVETRVEPGSKASMRFIARAAGRFAIETHGIGADKGRHITVVYVEVHPR